MQQQALPGGLSRRKPPAPDGFGFRPAAGAAEEVTALPGTVIFAKIPPLGWGKNVNPPPGASTLRSLPGFSIPDLPLDVCTRSAFVLASLRVP